MLQTGHPDEIVLESYCMNKLDGEQLDVFEEHLLVCGECQDRVTDTDSFVRGMRSALVAPVPEASAFGWDWKRYFQMPAPVWATAAVACAGIVGALTVYKLNPETAPLAIALSATRGGSVPTVKAGTPLDLDLDTLDLTPSVRDRIQIVNAEGTEVWFGIPSSLKNGHIHALVVARMSPGQYYVRLSDAAGIHREYSLRIGN